MKIEIKGVEFSNKGAELMLLSIIAQLDERLDDYQLVLSPGYLLPYEKRARLAAWQKFSFKCLGIDWTWLGNWLPAVLRQQLKHFGIVVEKDIDWVLDASGFVYSDQWGPERLAGTLKQMQRMARQHSGYIFLPQAFGPFATPGNGELMRQMIELAALVVSRDEDSFGHLERLVASNHTQHKKILQYPDFTVLMSVDQVPLPAVLPSEYVVIIPNNKMYIKKGKAGKQAYLKFLTNTVAQVRQLGHAPILLNHEGELDHKLLIALQRILPEPIVMLNDIDSLVVKKVITNAVFCVSSRYHGCISALSQGVPCIATSWSHKYRQLYQLYQCEALLIDIAIDSAQLARQMSEILQTRQTMSESLKQHGKLHRQQVMAMWDRIFARITMDGRKKFK